MASRAAISPFGLPPARGANEAILVACQPRQDDGRGPVREREGQEVSLRQSNGNDYASSEIVAHIQIKTIAPIFIMIISSSSPASRASWL